MNRRKHFIYIFVFSIFFTAALFGMNNHIAEASSITMPKFHFQVGTTSIADKGSYELKTPNNYITVLGENNEVPTNVTWTKPQDNVISLVDDSVPAGSIPYRRQMNREGPGYTTITANVTYNNMSVIIMCSVSVNLQVDQQKTGTVEATTTHIKVLALDSGASKQVFLKYVDYDSGSGNVTGAAISGAALIFDSDNKGVATVDSNGVVKAVGAGSATITVSTTTLSPTDVASTDKVVVMVRPEFSFVKSVSGTSITCKSVDDNNYPKAGESDGGVYKQVPSSFDLQTNAHSAEDVVLEVYNTTNGKRVLVDKNSNLLKYTVNSSGSVSFTNIKTGTYEIYMFSDKTVDENNKNVPYACMKIYVPIILNNITVVMNVGDTYNILENSNITDTNIFTKTATYDSEIISFFYDTYTFTANKKGTTTLTLTYNTGAGLYDDKSLNPSSNFEISITVIDGISLNMNNATIYTKGTLQLIALVTDNTSDIYWSSSNTTVATVADGLVTGVKEGGPVTITAKQKINGVWKKATCTIMVQKSVETISINPTKTTIAINSFLSIKATVTPSSMVNVQLQWKSSDETVAKIVDFSGLTATIQGLAGGHAVITAINKDNVVVGFCDITVRQPVAGITLSETAASPNLTQKILQLRATITPDNAVNKTIIWKSTDESKATVDENGMVTLKKPGTVTISATSADSPAIVAYCTLDIQIPVASIALDENVKTMYVGESARLSYVILPSNASNNVVTWVSSNPSIVAVDSAGKVTAKGVGTAVVILRTADGGFSTYCTITVKLVATSIQFDVNKLSLKTGEYRTLKTTLTPKGSTDNDLTWECSDTKIATVDSDGKVVAKSSGTCIVMAKTLAGGVAYCTVTVTQGVTSLVLNFSDKTIYKGESFTLEASINPTNATSLEVTWKSSNTKIATVNSKGDVKGLIGGVVIITCTTADGGYAATCVLTVKEAVTKIKLNHEAYFLGANKSVRLIATVTNETATDQKIAWSSSDEKVAIVSSNGKVTAFKAGYATITAMAKDGSEAEATCEVRVVTLVSKVSLSKSTMSMFVGESKPLKATIHPKNATLRRAKWTSSDPKIAIVDEDGTVIGIKAGSVMITASALDSSGKKNICYVSVYDRLASTGITLQDKKITLVPDEAKIVEMVLIPAASTDDVTWSSDNTAVASVNKDSGKITAKAPGTAYVTVMTDSGKTATIEVTVIGLNETKLIAEEYTDYKQRLTVEGATGLIKWQSSNPLVATISADGTVGARGVGTAIITATVNGRKLTCKVVVKSMPKPTVSRYLRTYI